MIICINAYNSLAGAELITLRFEARHPSLKVVK